MCCPINTNDYGTTWNLTDVNVCSLCYIIGIACCGLVTTKAEELAARTLALNSCLKNKCTTCLYLYGASMFTWCSSEGCDGMLNRKHASCPECKRPRCEVVAPSSSTRPRSLEKIARGADPLSMIRVDLLPQDPKELGRWLKGLADYGKNK